MSNDQITQTKEHSSVRRWTIALVISVFLVGAPPTLGLAGTVLGMIRAFRVLGVPGGSDPTVMAESIGTALMTTAIGLVVSSIALIPLTITIFGLVGARRRLQELK